jgi:hypothetical protein
VVSFSDYGDIGPTHEVIGLSSIENVCAREIFVGIVSEIRIVFVLSTV